MNQRPTAARSAGRSVRVAAVLAGLCVTLVGGPTAPTAAAAERLGYPWRDAVAVDAQGGQWGYRICPQNDQDCMMVRGRGSDGTVYGESDPWGYLLRNCTSYVAWRLTTAGVDGSLVGGLGNAGSWYDNAATRGVPVGSTPRVGAAAVTPASSGNPLGHVAYVEAVNANGTIVVAEYNAAAPGDGDHRTGTPAQLGFTGFVYFADAHSGAPAPSSPAPSGGGHRASTADRIDGVLRAMADHARRDGGFPLPPLPGPPQ